MLLLVCILHLCNNFCIRRLGIFKQTRFPRRKVAGKPSQTISLVDCRLSKTKRIEMLQVDFHLPRNYKGKIHHVENNKFSIVTVSNKIYIQPLILEHLYLNFLSSKAHFDIIFQMKRSGLK